MKNCRLEPSKPSKNMPGKKKKYNARFPPARIKKIMQSDEEVGKVAAPVPVIISRALEMFAETLLGRAKRVTAQRGARTLTPSHLKFCIHSETRFDFLRDLVSTVPDLQGDMDNEGAGVIGSQEVRPTGMGSGRGRGRGTTASHPRPPGIGTGKRRGRPPKIQDSSILPGATSKRIVEKFVDDEYDCEIMDEDDEGEDFERDEIKEPTSTYTNGGNSRVVNFNADSFSNPPSAHQNLPFNRSHSVPQGKVQLKFGPTEASLRYPTFSSPYNVQRSVSKHEFPGISFGGFQGPHSAPPVEIRLQEALSPPSAPSAPSPPSAYQLEMKIREPESSSKSLESPMEISRGAKVFSETQEQNSTRPTKPEQRIQSLPPPAPVYSGAHSRPHVGPKTDHVQLYPGYRAPSSSVNNIARVNIDPRGHFVSKPSWNVHQTTPINAFQPPAAKSPQMPGALLPSESPAYSFSTSNNTFSLKSGTNGTFTMAPLFPTQNAPLHGLQNQQTDSSNKISKPIFGTQPTQNAQLKPTSNQELDEDYDC